jgi:hypothetical protein
VTSLARSPQNRVPALRDPTPSTKGSQLNHVNRLSAHLRSREIVYINAALSQTLTRKQPIPHLYYDDPSAKSRPGPRSKQNNHAKGHNACRRSKARLTTTDQ